MKRTFLSLALIAIASALPFHVTDCPAMCSFCCDRDAACLNQYYEPPCEFPPALNPCAVPCRPPGLQPQSVPCAFKTACPSKRLPCYGVSYGAFPYPIFRLR